MIVYDAIPTPGRTGKHQRATFNISKESIICAPERHAPDNLLLFSAADNRIDYQLVDTITRRKLNHSDLGALERVASSASLGSCSRASTPVVVPGASALLAPALLAPPPPPPPPPPPAPSSHWLQVIDAFPSGD